MWVGVLWAGLRGAMWITHVTGKFRHGLLEESLIRTGLWLFYAYDQVAITGLLGSVNPPNSDRRIKPRRFRNLALFPVSMEDCHKNSCL